MYSFPRVAGWFGTERLVVIGSLAFVLRGLLAAGGGGPGAPVLIAPLEGIGFASVFVGGVTVLAAHAPPGLQGTAQGLFAASSGLAPIIGSLGGGAIAGASSIPGLFLVAAAVSLVGTGIIAFALLRPGAERISPHTREAPAGRSTGQSSRASSATSRIRSMNRYCQRSALISAILPASAG